MKTWKKWINIKSIKRSQLFLKLFESIVLVASSKILNLINNKATLNFVFLKIVSIIERRVFSITSSNVFAKKKCFKCFKKNHISKNKNVFYKNEDSATENELLAVLIVVDIKWNEIKKENWNDMTDDDVSNLFFENEFQTKN